MAKSPPSLLRYMDMDSLHDLLGKYAPREPAEMRTIKTYIDEHFHMTAGVAVTDTTIVVTVSSAALANTLRYRMHELRRLCDTSKKIILRIG